MNTRLNRSLFAAVLFAATGCGGVDNMDGDPPDEPDEPDTTAPSVVSTTPTTSATGVAANATITFTFSEQMDRATVEEAYSSPDLPLDKVSMEWNPAGTVLTISPDAELEYAEGIGTDLGAVAAKQYEVTIGAGAADVSGNALGADAKVTFATKRRMLANFPLVPELSRVIRETTVLSVANPIWIGDNGSGETYRSYVTFDLSALPANSEIEGAEFSARQSAPSGTPYSMGAINAQHVTFATMDTATAAQSTSLPGAFSEDAVLETKRLDVSPQVADDVANRVARGNRSQFRLQIDLSTDGDGSTDTAVFAKDTFSMLAIYVTN